MSKPTEAHLQPAQRILRHFQGTQGTRIAFGKTNSRTNETYADAGGNGSKVDVQDWCFIRGIFEQQATKEPSTMVAMTAVEAEFGTLAEAVKEVM